MEEDLQKREKMVFRYRHAVVIGVAVFSVVIAIFSLLGRHFFIAEIINNFRLQLSLGLLFVAVICWWVNLRPLSMAVFVFFCAYAWPVYCTFLPAGNPPSGSERISMLSINVLGENRDRQPVLDVIAEVDADIVLVVEYENNWIAPLEKLKNDYPFSIKQPRWRGFGIALFSKFEIKSSRVHQVTRKITDNPVIVAELDTGKQSFFVVGAHFLSPITNQKLQIRNAQMEEVGYIISNRRRQKDLPLILAGDFNCVAWSPFARQLLKHANLRDSRQGFFYQGSFPTDTDLISIPIDHAFVSDKIHIHQRRVLSANTSDHYPLYFEFSIAN